MKQRVINCQKLMKEQAIDAIVVRLSENVVLFSGYWPRNGFSFVFIPAEGDATVICPKAEAEDPSHGTLAQVRTFGHVKITDGDPYENVGSILKDLAKQYGIPTGGIIGMDIGSDAVSVPLCSGDLGIPGSKTIETAKEAFQAARIVPVGGIIDELRVCKNATDIEKLNTVNKIGKAGLRYFAAMINNPNTREIDVAAEIESFIARKAGSFPGVRYAKAWAQVSSGLRTADAWFSGIISSDRLLADGDLVMLEMGVCVDGYWCDLTETAVVGRMDATKAEMYSAVMQAQNDAIMEIKPGVTAGMIDQTARKTIERAGFGEYFNHNTGHGVGFCYHENMPILRPNSDHVLKSGMVHTVEPGIYVPGLGGVRLECNVLVCDTGYRLLGID